LVANYSQIGCKIKLFLRFGATKSYLSGKLTSTTELGEVFHILPIRGVSRQNYYIVLLTALVGFKFSFIS